MTLVGHQSQGAADDALQRVHGVDHVEHGEFVQRPGQDVSAAQPALRALTNPALPSDCNTFER